jgi:hypothetical protein
MEELIENLALFAKDPLAYVLWAFPWGEPGSELADEVGPEEWQRGVLNDITEGLLTADEAIRLATTSGHGIGKSALVAWLILWAMSTAVDTKGVVTANTENQLKTKTWVELAKWYRLCINKELFKLTATRLISVDPAHEDTWRFDMVPWSERNTEAFAGLHNKGKRIFLLFDEASAIPDVIWEVSEGALTDRGTEILWACFGNSTRNKGRFRECFKGGKFEKRWLSRAVDSRSVRFSNKKQIEEWAADYGEDSDFFRIRVRGVFPRVDASSFISFESATNAIEREFLISGEPVIIGVDVGRFGDDPSVIFPRCGRDAVTRPVELYHSIDTMQFASKVASAYLKYGAASVMIDSGGVGGGVVDRLRMLRIPVVEVDFGSSPDGVNFGDGAKYANKRAEIWGAMRNWLETGSIPERVHGADLTLIDELVAPSYSLNSQEAILLESKKDMRRRGVKSPNLADALACTFAAPVYIPPEGAEQEAFKVPKDYNPYDRERMAL